MNLSLNLKPVKILLIGCFFFLVTLAQLAAAFPAEAELKTRLHPGMTEQELIAEFGQPATENREQRNAYSFRYFPSVQLLSNEEEGYMGFEVHLVDDKVRDWRAIRGRPSYAPMKMPVSSRWTTAFWLLFLGSTFVYASIKVFNRQMNEEQLVRKAYQARDIPVGQLPDEFRFITHQTTVQEVIDQLGPYSLLRHHAVSQRFAESAELPAGTLDSYIYDLPYDAAIILLPEYPFGLLDPIRAAVYRPARMNDDP